MSDANDRDAEPIGSNGSSGDRAARSGSSGFLAPGEQETIQEWLVYVVGLFAAIAVAHGADAIAQDQWDHNLFDASGGAGFSGFGAGLGYIMIITAGITALVLFAVVVAWAVDNADGTAYKTVVVSSIVAMPVLYVLSGLLILIPEDNVSLEVVNAIVSGLGSGVAVAIGSAIAVAVTENLAPSALQQ